MGNLGAKKRESVDMMESGMEETREDWKRRKMIENGLSETGRDEEMGKMCVCSVYIYLPSAVHNNRCKNKRSSPLPIGEMECGDGVKVFVEVGT